MKPKNYLVFLICFLFLGTSAKAQHFDFGIEYGYSGYFGDLAPYSAIPSFTTNSTAKGYYFGYGNHLATVFFNYTSTTLSAHDKEAEFFHRNQRNLNFRSPILEWGLTTEVNLNAFVFRKYTRLQPILITGINLFYFSPQAFVDGQWIELQPLGTEGQGIPGLGREKYNLTQISIPLGAGLKYAVTDKIWVGFGIKARLTFTDYLDDVSTTYVDQETLRTYNGDLAADLAFRSDELDPKYKYPEEGELRGNPNENDWYMTTYLTFGVRFHKSDSPRRKIYCPAH